MKPTLLDKVISYFSPESGSRRLKSRMTQELAIRAYDAAKTFKADDWTSLSKGDANSEINSAQATLRDKGSDAVRNNPYAYKALTTIVNNTVGAGILPHIKGRSTLQTKRMNEAWRIWGETTLCDANGKVDFYGMQSLAMAGVVERGEVIVLKETDGKKNASLRLLESDYISNTSLESTKITGMTLDENGKVTGVTLYKKHPGGILFATTQTVEYTAAKFCHVYRIGRPGQVRGISWFAPVLRTLADLKDYLDTTLIGKKITACFAAFITSDTDDSLTAAQKITKRQNDSMLEPGLMKYLLPGEHVEFANPPTSSGSDEFITQCLRGIAAGMGITYESLTGDYSKVNYSSGRMGHLEMRKNVDAWRWQMLIPMFCVPAFNHFLSWAAANNYDTQGITCDWIPPAWSMLDPGKEIAAMKDALRNGLTSYPKAVRELGNEPDVILEDIAEYNDKFDQLGIKLDSDPRADQPTQQPSNQQGDNNNEANDAPTDSYSVS